MEISAVILETGPYNVTAVEADEATITRVGVRNERSSLTYEQVSGAERTSLWRSNDPRSL